MAVTLEAAAQAAVDKASRADAEQDAALRRAFADARVADARDAATAARDPSGIGRGGGSGGGLGGVAEGMEEEEGSLAERAIFGQEAELH